MFHYNVPSKISAGRSTPEISRDPLSDSHRNHVVRGTLLPAAVAAAQRAKVNARAKDGAGVPGRGAASPPPILCSLSISTEVPS